MRTNHLAQLRKQIAEKFEEARGPEPRRMSEEERRERSEKYALAPPRARGVGSLIVSEDDHVTSYTLLSFGCNLSPMGLGSEGLVVSSVSTSRGTIAVGAARPRFF
jgi:hypothetical protein